MKALRKPLSLLMAMLMCLGVFVGTGTTAFAAGETMTTYMIDPVSYTHLQRRPAMFPASGLRGKCGEN